MDDLVAWCRFTMFQLQLKEVARVCRGQTQNNPAMSHEPFSGPNCPLYFGVTCLRPINWSSNV
uniref:Uncharacterized protein n=1 Tax=Magallana gigas TaxID=29159 RepID=K1QFP0_MAGGI